MCFGSFFLRAVWIIGFRRQGGGARRKGGGYCGKPGETGLYSTSLQLAEARWSLCCVVVQSLSRVQFLAIPRTAACQASLSLTDSWSLLKLMAIELVMLSNHLILCHHPLLLLPSIFPSIRIFSNELALCITWPKNWSFSFSTSPSSEYSGWISFGIDWF